MAKNPEKLFLKNQWYVAAWSHEIGRTPLARRIAGERIVFYRTERGEAVAFDDCCPHRMAPLSLGTVIGDDLRCGYHGASFRSDGVCSFVPGNPVPKGARLRRYALVEKWGWAWIWLGAPDSSDESLLPDFHWQTAPGWAPIGGTLHFAAHYQLLVDNLLDLSHEAFLHANTIGNAAVADAPAHATVEGNKVRVTRLMPNCPAPPLFAKARGFTGNIDRLQDLLFTPPCYVTITVRATPAGTNDLSQALQWQVLNALTPETERTTHYFWGLPRQFLVDDRALDGMLDAAVVRTFNEDRAMLEAQQLVLEERSLDDRSLLTQADAGPSRARSIIAGLMRAEHTAAARAPASPQRGGGVARARERADG